jgi:hypothetical protein
MNILIYPIIAENLHNPDVPTKVRFSFEASRTTQPGKNSSVQWIQSSPYNLYIDDHI